MTHAETTVAYEVPARALRAIVRFASKDDTRRQLCCVRVETIGCSDGTWPGLVATDGHRLATVTWRRDGDETSWTDGTWSPVQIPREDAAKVIKLAPKDGMISVRSGSITVGGSVLTMDGRGSRGITENSERYDDALIPTSFPEWRRVLPDPDARTATACHLDPVYIADVCSAVADLSGARKGAIRRGAGMSIILAGAASKGWAESPVTMSARVVGSPITYELHAYTCPVAR